MKFAFLGGSIKYNFVHAADMHMLKFLSPYMGRVASAQSGFKNHRTQYILIQILSLTYDVKGLVEASCDFLNNTVGWQFGSHYAWVKKFLYGRVLYCPYLSHIRIPNRWGQTRIAFAYSQFFSIHSYFQLTLLQIPYSISCFIRNIFVLPIQPNFVSFRQLNSPSSFFFFSNKFHSFFLLD